MMLSHRGQAGVALSVLITAVTVGLAPSGVAQAAPQNQARRVAVIAGAQSINDTEARDEIKGTDLGIMWTDERGQILAAFGDTFGAGWTGPGSQAGTQPPLIGAQTPSPAATTATPLMAWSSPTSSPTTPATPRN
jgi:hypothetical protein